MRVRAVLAAAFMAGCSGQTEQSAGGPALDLAFSHDLRLNTGADVARLIDSLVVIVDHDGGLYAPGEEQTSGAVQVKDADGDPSDLELVITAKLSDARLPSIRLMRGGLPGTGLSFKALGHGGADPEPWAAGQIDGVSFGTGIADVTIPLNARAAHLPPRVMGVYEILWWPAAPDTSTCAVAGVTVHFSQPIDPSSLQGAITTEPGGAPKAVFIGKSGLTAQVVPNGLASQDGYVKFRLTLAPTLTGKNGQALDGNPGADGAQAFETDLEWHCGVDATVIPPSTAPPQCGLEDSPDAQCGLGFNCEEGDCIAANCNVACATGYVCPDQAPPFLSPASCVPDCRVYGGDSACDAGYHCSAETGDCS